MSEKRTVECGKCGFRYGSEHIDLTQTPDDGCANCECELLAVQLATRERELEEAERIVRGLVSGKSMTLIATAWLARRAPTNPETPGKVLVDATFLHEAKRLFRRAEDRLPMGAKIAGDIASWIDRANAMLPAE